MRKKVVLCGLIAIAILAYASLEYLAQGLCVRQTSFTYGPDSALIVGDSVQFRAGRSDLMMECELDSPLGVQWESTNPRILVVGSNGWVTAQALGSASVVVRAGVSSSARWDVRTIAREP